jgi:hypothetical protein
MVTFWGERYRNYFVNLFLASMLAPNNLPLLRSEEGHRFFIATTREDWVAIKELPIMCRIQRHVVPRWVEVTGPPSEQVRSEHERYAAVLRHMNVCIQKVLDAGYHPTAYGSFHLPDTVFSDGMVAALLAAVRRKDQLVLCPVLRQSEEDVLADLAQLGLWSCSPPASSTARVLTLKQSQAAELAVRHLHPEVHIFEEDGVNQLTSPPFRYWRVPEGRGILLNTFFVAPVLMDYTCVPSDHTRCLDHDSFENVYIRANFGNSAAIHVVQDSDEFLMLSLTPKSINHSPSSIPSAGRRSALRRHYDCLREIRHSFRTYVVRDRDLIRHNLGCILVRWRTRELDPVWLKEEYRINRLLHRAIGDYYSKGSRNGQFVPSRFNWRAVLLDISISALSLAVGGLIYRLLLKVYPAGYTLSIRQRWRARDAFSAK